MQHTENTRNESANEKIDVKQWFLEDICPQPWNYILFNEDLLLLLLLLLPNVQIGYFDSLFKHLIKWITLKIKKF